MISYATLLGTSTLQTDSVNSDTITTNTLTVNDTLTIKNDTGTTIISTQSTDLTNFALPTNNGTNNNLLQTDGSGNTSWVQDINVNEIVVNGNINLGPFKQIKAFAGTYMINDVSSIQIKNTSSQYGTLFMTQAEDSVFLLPPNTGSLHDLLTTDGEGNASWTTDINVTDCVVNNNISLGPGSSIQPFAGLFTIDGASNINLKNNSDEAGTLLKTQASGSIFSLPPNNGSNFNLLQTDGSGNTSWVNDINIHDCVVNNNISIGPGSSIQPFAGLFTISGLSSINLKNGSSDFGTSLTTQSTESVFSLPPDNGTSYDLLTTDGSGNTSWVNDININNCVVNGYVSIGPSNKIQPIAGTFDIEGVKNITVKNANSDVGTIIKTQSTDSIFSLPSDNGVVNNLLKTDGYGNTIWTSNLSIETLIANNYIQTNSYIYANDNIYIANAKTITSIYGTFNIDSLKTFTLKNANSDYGTVITTQSIDSKFAFPSDSGNKYQILMKDGNSSSGNTKWAGFDKLSYISLVGLVLTHNTSTLVPFNTVDYSDLPSGILSIVGSPYTTEFKNASSNDIYCQVSYSASFSSSSTDYRVEMCILRTPSGAAQKYAINRTRYQVSSLTVGINGSYLVRVPPTETVAISMTYFSNVGTASLSVSEAGISIIAYP